MCMESLDKYCTVVIIYLKQKANLAYYHNAKTHRTNILTNYCIHDMRVKRNEVQSCETGF